MQRHLLTLAALCAVSPSFMLMPDAGGSPGGGACLNTLGLQKWQSHKNVWAGKIAGLTDKGGIPALAVEPGGVKDNLLIAVGQAWLDKHKPEVGGYFVLYSDGYRSYSPAKAFEEGNSLAGEMDQPGEIAYLAFSGCVGGEPVPWLELDDVQQRAWNRAARAVSSETLREYREANEAPGDLETIIGEAIGEASLQWTPKPTGVFDSTGAAALAKRTCHRVVCFLANAQFTSMAEAGGQLVARDPAPPLASLGDPRALETAWGLIANVSGGNWSKQDPAWVEAAEKFRDEIHYPSLKNLGTLAAGQAPRPYVKTDHVMRARFLVVEVSPRPEVDGGVQTLEMMAVGPDGNFDENGFDPDSTFSKWTPTALLEMSIANPALFDKIQRGDKYHVDFSLCHREPKAEKPTPADAQPGGEQPIPANPGGGIGATITHLAAKDAAGQDVPTPQQPALSDAPQSDPLSAGGEPTHFEEGQIK